MPDPVLRAILHDLLERPWRFAMGLKALEPASWLVVTGRHAAEVAEKRRLLAEGADIRRLLPEAEDAAAEMAELLEDHLVRHQPGIAIDTTIADSLVRLGLAVQEDLCLMLKGPDGYRLAGAFVAFPNRWNLRDKIGRTMAGIHTPVPGLEPAIGRPVSLFFERLLAGQPVRRANWSISDNPTLHQPSHTFRRSGTVVGPAEAGERLWLRVERQTLTRLPRSQAVLFTIFTFVEPLAALKAEPLLASRLADRLAELPPAMLTYKNLATNKAAIEQYLRAAANAPAASA